MNGVARRELMDKLYRDTEFAKLSCNIERIEHILANHIDYEQFESLIETNMKWVKQKAAKDLAMAQSYRSMADGVMVQANMDKAAVRTQEVRKAMEAYQQAILYAPHNETALLTALYSCKSLLHLELGEYQAALYAIDVALDLSLRHPTNSAQVNKIEHLVQKFNCLKLLEKFGAALKLIDEIIEQAKQDGEEYPEHVFLDMQHNVQAIMEQRNIKADGGEQGSKIVPFYGYKFDPRCKIETSAVVGRHFIALDDIPAGTVLLEEKPYSIIIEPDYLHKKCSNCYKELKYKFYPCHYCIDLLFCDLKCFEETDKLFHRHECGMVLCLKQITSPTFHVFRMISRVGPLDAFKAETNKSNYSVKDYLEDLTHRDVPEVEKTHEKRVKSYQMSSLLWDHDSKHGLQSNVHHTVVGIEVAILLDIVHDYRDKAERFGLPGFSLMKFIDMVVVDTRRIIFNVFGWHEYNEDWTLRAHVANCQCLVGSLINHSCVPNTNWEFHDGHIKFTTNQKISSGGEITITYGPNKEMPYPRRQERLNHYFFACKCSACLEEARQDKSLKCPQCKGPVLFDSVVNQKPHLSGKCLECFKKLKDFDETVKQFKADKATIRDLGAKSVVFHDQALAAQAVQLTKRVVDVTGYFNSEIYELISICSRIVERIHGNEAGMQDIYKFGQFIDETFPLDLKLDIVDDESLQSMHFWFDRFMGFVVELHNNSELLSQYDECEVWNVLFKYHYRVQCLLKTISKKIGEDGSSVSKMAKKIIFTVVNANNAKLEQLKQTCADNVSFVTA